MERFKLHHDGEDSGSSFSNKVENIFSRLDVLADKQESTLAAEKSQIKEDESVSKNDQSHDDTSPLKKSSFKRPNRPSQKVRRMRKPSHDRNPEKWTRYDLSDVKSDELSDRANTSAAFSFLKELKSRKQKKDDNYICDKVEFRSNPKPEYKHSNNATATCTSATDKHGSYCGSKHIMPDYEVGVNSKTLKMKKTFNQECTETKSSVACGGRIELGHLSHSSVGDIDSANESLTSGTSKSAENTFFKVSSKAKKAYRLKRKIDDDDDDGESDG